MPAKPAANHRLACDMIMAGLSVAGLAARAGVSRRTLSALLHRPEHRPRAETVARVTSALHPSATTTTTTTKAPSP